MEVNILFDDCLITIWAFDAVWAFGKAGLKQIAGMIGYQRRLHDLTTNPGGFLA